MSITNTTERTQATAQSAVNRGDVVVFKPPRLPYHEAVQERFGVDKAGWKALIDAIYPLAKTADAVIMALSYCRARKLDPFKRPVHIVPMWSSASGAMVETVWPGISELRTTAFRTGQYAGMDAPEFGPEIEQAFSGRATRGASKGQERNATIRFPQWCRITIKRDLGGRERTFVGPKVYWLEAYAKWADTDVPNDMWIRRGIGQLEKCAEAAALRRTFPEEIGNDLTAEEMEGQRLTEPTAAGISEMPPDPPPAARIAKPQAPVIIEDEPPHDEHGVIWEEHGERPATPDDALADDPTTGMPRFLKRQNGNGFAPWVEELANAVSGCEDLSSIAEKQVAIMAKQRATSTDRDWREGERIVSEAVERVRQANRPNIISAG